MRGRLGTQRAISRKTVRPPTPLSKIPIALFVVRSSLFVSSLEERRTENEELFGGFSGRDTRALSFDVVLLDLLVQIRSRSIDRLRRLGNVPAVLAQFRQDERPFRLVFEGLQRRQLHRGGDDLRRCPEKLSGKIGD